MKTDFDWAEIAFGSKKPLRELNAVFIAAPRSLSVKRFTQLIKQYLPLGNILLGVAKEPYVLGFERQPQFNMLRASDVTAVIAKVNTSTSRHKIYTLHYFQREQKHLLDKLKFQRAVFVNGSWKYTFHTGESFYALTRAELAYECVSPFADEAEAREYEASVAPELHTLYDTQLAPGAPHSSKQMLEAAQTAAQFSFDHSYQTGVALGKKDAQKDSYELLATAFNTVVPYQTYAWHHGPSREVNFSPPGDLNHYDAVHAEVELIVTAQKRHIDLSGTSLFINLLPCPSCARMFTQTDIAEFVYREDHSDGYGVKMLELAGKKVRRVV